MISFAGVADAPQGGLPLTASRGLLEDGPGFKEGFDSVSPIFPADAGVLESSPRRLRIIGHVVDYHAPGTYL
jgi:hypothetical protein